MITSSKGEKTNESDYRSYLFMVAAISMSLIDLGHAKARRDVEKKIVAEESEELKGSNWKKKYGRRWRRD